MKKRERMVRLLVAAAAAALLGCGGEEGPQRTHFEVELVGGGGQGLHNDFGYQVDLTEARLHLGPIHFYSGEPLFTRGTPRERWPTRLARQIFGLRLAHAHPGHYQEGEALGETLSAATVDLLASTPSRLGRAEGITGDYRSARVAYAPSADIDGHAARVRGVAEKGGHRVAFVGHLDASDAVAGIACAAAVGADGGVMRVSIELVQWIARIDFAQLNGGASEIVLEPGSQGHNALTRGIHNTSAFSFTFNKE